MLVSVRSVTGQTLAVHNVDESGAVLDLKRSIEHQHNVPSHLQRIIYAGRELDDNATLAASGIVDSTLVQLVVRPDRPVSDEAFARMMQEHEIEQAAHDPNGQPVAVPYTLEQIQVMQRLNAGVSSHMSTTSADDDMKALSAYVHSKTVIMFVLIDTFVLWYALIFLRLPLVGGIVQYVVLVAAFIVPFVGYVGAKFYRTGLLALYSAYVAVNAVYRIYLIAAYSSGGIVVFFESIGVVMEFIILAITLRFIRVIRQLAGSDLTLLVAGVHEVQQRHSQSSV